MQSARSPRYGTAPGTRRISAVVLGLVAALTGAGIGGMHALADTSPVTSTPPVTGPPPAAAGGAPGTWPGTASGVAAATARSEARRPARTSRPWSLPVRSGTPVSGRFGEFGTYWPTGHAGIDFDGGFGDPIFAATNGQVTYARYNTGGYGNLVMIMRADGTQTRYAHLDSIAVKVGDRVTAGERIGRMGATGQATGAHLHFEVRVNNGVTPTDPTSLWSGKRPGIPAPPPAWSCARYGGC